MKARSRSQLLRRILHHGREEQSYKSARRPGDNIDTYLALENARLRAKGRKGRLIAYAKGRAQRGDESLSQRLKRIGIR